MTKQVQIRRGTDSQHTSFTGAEGEISVNTTNDSVHVHDGTTAGGKEMARADGSNVAFTGGTIDGAVIGGTTPAAGTFTTGDFNTSLNVDGTITSDGLTVDGTSSEVISVNSTANGSQIFFDSATTSADWIAGISNDATDDFLIYQGASGTGDIRLYTKDKKRLEIDADGDISFYEDTGTTAKLFWDASAEALGIGQSAPAGQLHLTSSDITDQVIIENTDTSAAAAPDLVLWKNSSSPADNDALGQVFFRGENSSGTATNYAAIDAVSADVTAGTEDGKLRFQTRAAGSIADRLVIDGQNVGIGTTPDSNALLHLKKTSAVDTILRVENTNAGGYGSVLNLKSTGNFSFSQFEGGTKTWLVGQRGLSGGSFSIYDVDNTAHRMVIDSSGNLLHGTTTAASSTNVTTVHSSSTGGTYTQYHSASGGSTVGTGVNDFRVYTYTGAVGSETYTERMRIDSSGNVDLYQGNNLTWRYAAGSTIRGSITVDSADNIKLSNGSSNTERMRIASDGSLLVGTIVTSPTSTNAGLQFYKNTGEKTGRINSYQDSSNSSATRIAFFRGTSAIGSITTSSASTAYNTTSDYRLKENVTDITDGIERVKQLNPSRFNFIADADTTVDGFLAHEVSDIVPEAITGEKDATRDEEYEVTPAVLDDDGNVVTEAVMGTRSVPDYQGIDQSKLVPLLTAALQEAIAKIETLEAKVTALENA